MTQKCKALNSRGKPCSCFARRDDPAGLCVFHSRLPAPGHERAVQPLTKADLIRMLDSTIRSVKNAKGPTAMEKARELRSLIIERAKLLDEEPDSKRLSVEERLALRQ